MIKVKVVLWNREYKMNSMAFSLAHKLCVSVCVAKDADLGKEKEREEKKIIRTINNIVVVVVFGYLKLDRNLYLNKVYINKKKKNETETTNNIKKE
uniref:Uncharacterized protein n=1 Tax=Octopus bimaculoides TaxID=37653 RepID=A0A0L8HT17_OCTBM